MAFKSGQEVIVEHMGVWKDATFVAPLSKKECQVELVDGKVVHVERCKILPKGKCDHERSD